MEPEGSIPCSQDPVTGPYPESDASEWFLPFRTSDQSLLWTSHLSHACYIPTFPGDLILHETIILTIMAKGMDKQ